MAIQHKQLDERVTPDMVALAPQPAGISSIPPELASTMDTQNEVWKEHRECSMKAWIIFSKITVNFSFY